MKQSEDYTIFAWKSAENNLHERGIFARSPAEFGNVVRSTEKQVIAQFVTPFHELPDPAALTSRGLKIGLPLLFEYGVEDRVSGAQEASLSNFSAFSPVHRPQSSDERVGLKPGIYMALICRVNSENNVKPQILCIWLRKHVDRGSLTRLHPQSVALLPEEQAGDFEVYTVYAKPS